MLSRKTYFIFCTCSVYAFQIINFQQQRKKKNPNYKVERSKSGNGLLSCSWNYTLWTIRTKLNFRTVFSFHVFAVIVVTFHWVKFDFIIFDGLSYFMSTSLEIVLFLFFYSNGFSCYWGFRKSFNFLQFFFRNLFVQKWKRLLKGYVHTPTCKRM